MSFINQLNFKRNIRKLWNKQKRRRKNWKNKKSISVTKRKPSTNTKKYARKSLRLSSGKLFKS